MGRNLIEQLKQWGKEIIAKSVESSEDTKDNCPTFPKMTINEVPTSKRIEFINITVKRGDSNQHIFDKTSPML